MVEHIPTKEGLFVVIDANAWTRKRMEVYDDGKVLGAHGRDELNKNGEHLLIFAKTPSSLSRTRFETQGSVEYLVRSMALAAATTKHRLTNSQPDEHTDLPCMM